MEIQERNDAKGEGLNESWVQLHFHQELLAGEARDTNSPPTPPTLSRPLQLNTQMEKLLLEAQRDSLSRSSRASSINASIASSVNASVASSRASPKSPHSPNNEPNSEQGLPPFSTPFTDIPEASKGTDWIWDWSSRPEALPPSEWGSRFKHPKRHKLSIRNTRVMSSGPFNMENLPTLLFTHACTFIMGAAVMFIYLKKYCQMSVITID